jgi:2-polyprenyl-3-methyl-5-hydroxy-6-metoxy-1,4-benzoquinol methylase
MRRRFDPREPELMDLPQPVSTELESDLRNLRALNRHLGSHRLVRHFLRRWIKRGDQLRVLDLATGSGDIPRLLVDFARQVGAKVEVDAVDLQSSTLAIARALSAGYPEVQYHCANIRQFGEEAAYDIVFCSLALHHFIEADAVDLLGRCRDLSRAYVLVADLRRGWVASLGVDLITRFIFREPMTRHDARISAARSSSFRELHELARAAGWDRFGHRRFLSARQAIWLEHARQP